MNNLTIEFYRCVYWAGMCFISGVSLREWAPDAFGKWFGRFNVLVAVSQLAIFSQYSVDRCQIQYQITAAKPAKEISNAIGTNEDSSQPSIASGEIRTPAGHVVTYSIANESANANDRSVPGIGGSERWRFGGYRQRDNGTPSGIDGRDFTTAGARRLPFASPSLSDLR